VKVLSLFSGVGGFDLGLENAGMETVFQCEWDKHATKILERHWPHVPRWDDVSTLTGEHILRHAPVIDVVAWGSPCQDLSVAGKRAGLRGARSGLFHEGVRIIKELRSLTNGKYPRISIWENVAGALSSGAGADFGQVLTEMDEAGTCFSEWRILDAQYFGVPQRRRRVFLISVFDTATAARCPDPLLPVREGVQWHPQTSNQARQTTTSETSASFGSGSYGGWTPTDTAITLSQRDHKGSMTMVVGSLAARDYKGVGNQYVDEGELVTEPVLLTMREGKPGGGKRPLLSTDKSLSLRTGNEQTLFAPVEDPILFENSYRDAARIATEGVTNTLSAKMGTGGNNTPMVAFPIQDGREMEKNQNGIGVADDGTPAYTLDQTGAQAVAYSVREDAKANTFSATELDRANALSALRPSPQSHHAQMFIAEGTEAVAFDGYNQTISDVSQTIRADKSDGDHVGMTFHQATMAVRRLTPLECERLMGWPDDWTAGQSDTHRYKQCGNGVASPVAQWIAEQLLQIDQ
jgi:DNA (cytosine-5)-methyltransferase 1